MVERISSVQNSLVKQVFKLKESAKAREEEGLTIVEGRSLLHDLVSHITPEVVLATEKQEDLLQYGKKAFLVSDEVMRKISTVEAPEGVLGLFPIRYASLRHLPEAPFLILDGLQDPGNVGTLLRTASAFGLDHLIGVPPLCDLWSPKVMRSAKGAHYYFKTIIKASWEQLVPTLQEKKVELFAASLQGICLRTIPRAEKWALVLGSESHGLRIPSSVQATYFTIPMVPHIESLNVAQAGAIALYHFAGLDGP